MLLCTSTHRLYDPAFGGVCVCVCRVCCTPHSSDAERRKGQWPHFTRGAGGADGEQSDWWLRGGGQMMGWTGGSLTDGTAVSAHVPGKCHVTENNSFSLGLIHNRQQTNKSSGQLGKWNSNQIKHKVRKQQLRKQSYHKLHLVAAASFWSCYMIFISIRTLPSCFFWTF